MEGFLNKQGEKGLVLNLWRKRWFQLDPNNQRIYYYKTKSKEELLGAINLAEGTLPMCFIFNHFSTHEVPNRAI